MDYLTPEMIKARQDQMVAARADVLDLNSPALYIAAGVIAFVVIFMIKKRK